jgi:voltage-gated potassium channel
MMYRLWNRLTHTSRSVYLLVSLAVLIFVYPTVSDYPLARLVLGISFLSTPLTGVYAVSRKKRTVWIAAILAAPAFLAILGHFFLRSSIVGDEVLLVPLAVYYPFTTIAIIRHIFTKHEVDSDTIISAVSAYLMIGLSFAVAFMLVHVHSSGALVETTADHVVAWPDVFYFSIVTLTTLGYGDISPVIPVSRSLATLEAVCGVLYMSILIARLVSEYQATRRREDRSVE